MRVSTRRPEPADFSTFATLVADHDGIGAFGEASVRDVTEDRPARYICVYDDELIAALVMGREGTELAVHPEHRRHGWGTELLSHGISIAKQLNLWSHGDLEPARSLAGKLGLEATRELLEMAVDLEGVVNEIDTGDIELRDVTGLEDELVELNNRIFASHPEQGRLTTGDLEKKGGVIQLAYRNETLVGFYWIQVDNPELYVLGVAPEAGGQGLGTLLTSLAMADLKNRGAHTMSLFVDGTNEAAVAVYKKTGFTVSRRDIQYNEPAV